MKESKIWVEKLLAELEQQEIKRPGIKRLFDELVYGKNNVCLMRDNTIENNFTFYISEDIPEVLVIAKPGYQELYFNLRECSITGESAKHQVQMQLQGKQYIIINQHSQEMILVFPHQDQKELMLYFFKFYNTQLAKLPVDIDSLLLLTFLTVDKNRNMTLSTDEVNMLLKKLRLESNQYIEGVIQFVRLEDLSDGEMTYREFEKVMKIMQCRVEFKGVYERIAMKKLKSYKFYLQKYLKVSDFIIFLEKEQKESSKHAQQIAKTYFKQDEKISFLEFSKFMISKYNDINEASYEQILQDKSFPLTRYYCRSSHNTYLTGNQFTSDSKIQRFKQDLENGYRCLQIDIHDGDKEPIVKHGYTLTSSITFRKVIESINDFSKKNDNHTPIILSLQDHTSFQQQYMVANILKECFTSDKLLVISPQKSSYPTLAQAMGKIIIKHTGNFLLYSSNESEMKLDINQIQPQESAPTKIFKIENQLKYKEYVKRLQQFNSLKQQLIQGKAQFLKIPKLLSNSKISEIKTNKKFHPDLIKITAMLSTGNIKTPNIWQSISISENSVNKYYEDTENNKIMKNHTKTHWVRSYPSASRVQSSNFNPIPSLELGIQIIAINSQFVDEYNAVINSFFKKSRKNCAGYRLKSNQSDQSDQSKIELSICPISAYMISPYKQSNKIPPIQVKMMFIGSGADMSENKSSYGFLEPYTEQIKSNAYNPVFQNNRTMVLTVKNPQFSFVYLQISDCGFAVLQLEQIKQGYRSFNLYNKNLQEGSGKVIVRVDRNQIIQK